MAEISSTIKTRKGDEECPLGLKHLEVLMFNAKYVGFDKYNKGSINLTYSALGHGDIPSF